MAARTEKELMLAGEPYLASDPELVASRLAARRLLREYDATAPDDARGRRDLLGRLLGRIGARIEIEPPFFCDYGWNISAGDNLFMNTGCVVLDCAPVTIGENVLFGPAVHIYAATHPVDPDIRRTGRELAAAVTVGDDVWIGGGVILCPGVTIGAGSSVAAGSVVTGDIPARVLAAGNPCRVIRPV